MQSLIPFSDISEQGVAFDVSELSWFPDELLEGAGPVTAEIRLTRKQAFKIEIKGTLRSGIRLYCDRCLHEYGYTIDSRFILLLELSDSSHHLRVQDIECDKADLDIIQVREPVVDLGDVLRQQLFLSLPEKRLCNNACKGLCRRCGANINSEQCSCNTTEINSPFAALASLKKKNND